MYVVMMKDDELLGVGSLVKKCIISSVRVESMMINLQFRKY